MNREQIMQLSAEQVNVAIGLAKEHESWAIVYPKGTPMPSWSTSIAAAWELVEEMTDRNNPNFCTFRILRTDGWEEGQDWGYEIVIGKPFHGGTDEVAVWADTAPLAICRAWLLWQAGRIPAEEEGGKNSENCLLKKK